MTMISDVLRRFGRHHLCNDESTVVVVEELYVDPRDRHGERDRHVSDARELVNELAIRHPQVQVETVAFVNDFCDQPVCGLAGRHGTEESASSVDATAAVGAHVFFMRTTRNRSTKSAKRALDRGVSRGLGVVMEAAAGTELATNIVARTASGEVHLGTRELGTGRLLPRCTMIMAQHYFDILKHVERKRRKLRELWIVDFSRYDERDRVHMGAEAAFVVNPWPRDVDARIMNCIYPPPTGGEPKVLVSESHAE